jgi:hypothetical protein
LDDIAKAAAYVAKASVEDSSDSGDDDAEHGILQVKGPISQDKFVRIPAAKACAHSAAIDGGSATVLDCGSFVVGAITVGSAVSDGESRWRATSRTMLVSASRADMKGIYSRIFRDAAGEEPKDFPRSLDSLIGRARNLAELREAAKAVASSPEGALVTIDGALWAGLADFAPLIDRLVNESVSRGVCLAGVSKRSMLYHGHRPLVPYLARLGRSAVGDALWAYPVALADYGGRTFGATYVAHLHPRAQFAFRVDINPLPSFAADDIVAMLASLSDDPGYLGYPYPLARVHNEVAISGEEKAEMALGIRRALGAAGGDVSLVEEFASNFHDILDGGI